MIGVPSRIRTCDLLIRSQSLCPPELLGHTWRERLGSNQRIAALQAAALNQLGYVLKKAFP